MKKNIFKILSLIAFLVILVTPFSSFAEEPLGPYNNPDDPTTPAPASSGCKAPSNIGELFEYATCILTANVIPFLIGLGLILFIAGIVRFVSAGDNEEKREGGRDMMIFGIIALFVMVSVWGFVKILFNTFFPNSAYELPALPEKSKEPFKRY